MKPLQAEADIKYSNQTAPVACCAICGKPLKAVWENTGFAPPDPTNYEIVGYEQCSHPNYE